MSLGEERGMPPVQELDDRIERNVLAERIYEALERCTSCGPSERSALAERIYIASISYTTHGVFLPSIEACYAAADKLLAARTKA